MNKSSEWLAGYETARKEAIKICECAVIAWQMGAGSEHSSEARMIGEAQAKWCSEEIRHMRLREIVSISDAP